VVGGHAVAYHGHPRATKDLDVLVRADKENAERVYRALAAFGARPRRSRSRSTTSRPMTESFRSAFRPIASTSSIASRE
jgi:hypothetical protein